MSDNRRPDREGNDGSIDNSSESPDSENSPGAISIALSVIAAAFGVQTEANRERDFEHGNPVVYIIAGIIFTVLFVLTIMGVVALVLPD